MPTFIAPTALPMTPTSSIRAPADTRGEVTARKASPPKLRMLRAKPPNISGRGPLLDGPGLTVAVVAIVKDEADYLEDGTFVKLREISFVYTVPSAFASLVEQVKAATAAAA